MFIDNMNNRDAFHPHNVAGRFVVKQKCSGVLTARNRIETTLGDLHCLQDNEIGLSVTLIESLIAFGYTRCKRINNLSVEGCRE